ASGIDHQRAAIMEPITLASHRRRGALIPLVVVCCCFLHAVSGSAARAGDTPVSVRVVPERVTLSGARAAQRFVVLGTFADGLERDVTSQSRFSLSDSRFASLDQAGRVAARADGELDLKVEVGNRVAKAYIRIEGSKESA